MIQFINLHNRSLALSITNLRILFNPRSTIPNQSLNPAINESPIDQRYSNVVDDARLALRDARRQGERMIKAIKFVSIPVRDQDRALEFYTQALGLRVMTDQPFDDRQR
jgi:Glyoxalase/Bleomycin resistance protein/Dioxygenase superfamily